MIKNILASITLISLWTTLFAPLSLAQNSNRAVKAAVDTARSAVSKDSDDKEKKGLEFTIREADPEKPRPVPMPVLATKLNANESEAIIRRLPPLRVEENQEEFRLISSNSLPPPKSGTVINSKFPAEENAFVPNTATANALQIVAATPNGNLETVTEIAVAFSQPMIGISSQKEVNENIPVKLSPSAKGKWRWLGTNTLVFNAETRLPKATTYTATIKAGTKSAVGGTLEKDYSWKFSTNPVKVVSFSAADKTVERDEILLVEFDQVINPNDILSKTTATADNKKIELRLAAESEIFANETISKRIEDLLPNRWIALRAKEILPLNATVNIIFDKGLSSAEGNLKTTEEQKFSFKVYDILKLEKKNCGYGKPKTVCSPSEIWQFEFNNRIDEDSFDKSQIKISPNIKINHFLFTITK